MYSSFNKLMTNLIFPIQGIGTGKLNCSSTILLSMNNEMLTYFNAYKNNVIDYEKVTVDISTEF